MEGLNNSPKSKEDLEKEAAERRKKIEELYFKDKFSNENFPDPDNDVERHNLNESSKKEYNDDEYDY